MQCVFLKILNIQDLFLKFIVDSFTDDFLIYEKIMEEFLSISVEISVVGFGDGCDSVMDMSNAQIMLSQT